MPHVFEVAELTRALKSVVESEFPFVWVRGQVSNLVKQINPTKQNISSMTDEMRVALWAALDGLEAGATSNAEFD